MKNCHHRPSICIIRNIPREEMLTLMKGSLFVQMEEDGIEERDDSVKDLVHIFIIMIIVCIVIASITIIILINIQG